MYTLAYRAQIFTLSVATITLLLASNLANADIYKWRNDRGVIQYSDKPPVSGFSKATQHEIVNSLQSKDMCADPVSGKIIKTAANSSNLRANFLLPGTSISIGTTTPVAPTNSVIGTVIGIKPTATVPKPVVTTPTTPKPTTPVVTIPISTTPAPTTPATTPTLATTPPASSTQNIVQTALMPAVDINKNVIPATGYSTLRIQSTTQTTGVIGEGAFRIACGVSHMSNDDPIVYPNQKGAAHHHTFFGNTSTNYASDINNMANTGNSTCSGGIANRSAYWMPTMIDTSTNTPINVIGASFYYKTGYGGVPTKLIVAPPKGLRMISGNSKATTAATSKRVGYSCIPKVGYTTPWTASVQNCNVTDELLMAVTFPQCWDGKNLDSPDHISHMADSGANTANGCPLSHPVPLPAITFNAKFTITKPNQALTWRLASDNYAKTLPGGYSGHADWVNGWDETVMAGIIKNCINTGKDCHSFLLGDGRTLY